MPVDPLKLPIPGDYDDYWYQGEDSEWYNEYDDELEEGYYYTKEKKLPAWCSAPKAIPRPPDYEDYWYEGEDGSWYNEYDEELYPGQYYVEDKAEKAERRVAKITSCLRPQLPVQSAAQQGANLSVKVRYRILLRFLSQIIKL